MQDLLILGSCMLGIGFILGVFYETWRLKLYRHQIMESAREHFQQYAKAMVDAAFVLQQENEELREKLKQYEAEVPK